MMAITTSSSMSANPRRILIGHLAVSRAGRRRAVGRPWFASGRRLPDLHRPVPAAGNQFLAVGTKGDAFHPVSVPAEGGDLLARRGIPDFDGAIVARRGGTSSVG